MTEITVVNQETKDLLIEFAEAWEDTCDDKGKTIVNITEITSILSYMREQNTCACCITSIVKDLEIRPEVKEDE